MKNKIKYIVLFITALVLTNCADLEIENINQPDKEAVLTEPDGVKGIAAGLFNTWFSQEQHNFGSPVLFNVVMADWGTVTFANYGTLDMSKEPRVSFDNQPSYPYQSITQNYWRYMYSVITSANDVVFAIDNGLEIGDRGAETMMTKGMGYFMQGLGNGYIGLVFDKAYPSDENTNYEALDEASYQESIQKAIEQLNKAIEVFDNNTFTLPPEWINGNAFSNTDMSKLAHSFIARLLVYSPRNIEETNAIDWTSVLNHSEKGITNDFSVDGDGNGTVRRWMSWYKYYMARENWGKVDMRVVNMLDETIPANWPEDGLTELPHEGKIISNDLRVSSDFEYNTANSRPERGTYRWSTYRYKRLDSYINANFFAPVIMMRKAEIDLFKAEALMHLEYFEDAAAVINAGTRTNRGGLPPVSANLEAIKNAIAYERTIELPLTGMGIEYFDMRRNGLLQDGSLLHFPIPSKQLEVMQQPFYTFGGINPQFGVPNVDVAVDGWYKP